MAPRPPWPAFRPAFLPPNPTAIAAFVSVHAHRYWLQYMAYVDAVNVLIEEAAEELEEEVAEEEELAEYGGAFAALRIVAVLALVFLAMVFAGLTLGLMGLDVAGLEVIVQVQRPLCVFPLVSSFVVALWCSRRDVRVGCRRARSPRPRGEGVCPTNAFVCCYSMQGLTASVRRSPSLPPVLRVRVRRVVARLACAGCCA